MAESAVSSAIQNVGNFVIQEGNFLCGIRDQVDEMQKELKWMHCFLTDSEIKKGESGLARSWASEIREAAYDAEDLIERFFLKSALRNRKGVANRIKKYAFCINHVVDLHHVGSRIEVIKAKLSNLRMRLQTYCIWERRVGGQEAAAGCSTSRRKRQDYAHIVDHNLVGLDEKITELVEHLIDIRKASVVCIYGIGGLGKTTTAKQVFIDNRVRASFECFAWVYISRQFNQRQVLESILTQLSDNKEGVKSMSEEELSSQLCCLQKEKKCLLVIDDIWQNEDWDKLSAAFPYLDTDNRSKILVTTRNQNVASYGVYCTSLDILDHKSSLGLLKDTILFLGGPNHPIKESSELGKCAEEMVKMCAGLPQAITVLGGILATKHELLEWERVGANQKWNDGVKKVLELSYEDLPYHLKSCFLYFSQYREDAEIKTITLIQMWIGEGFISPSMEEGGETMEDVGEEYLNELVSRCMIQVGKRGLRGRVKTCRMHDLMWDLCISKAREEGFAHSVKLGVENEGIGVLEMISSRRLCVSVRGSSNNKLDESISSSLKEISPQLRSIWLHHSDYPIPDDDQGFAAAATAAALAVLILKKLKLVRVLELPSMIWYYWVESGRGRISNLIHLRFLKLEHAMLPTSIGNLRCLQTLNLVSCCGPIKIPDSLWGMEQLRHLYLPSDECFCESSEQRVGNLRNLQTLVNFPPKKFNLQQNLAKFTNVRKFVIIRSLEEIGMVIKNERIVFMGLQALSIRHPYGNVDLEDMTRGLPRLYRLVVSGRIVFPATPTAIWPSNLTKLVLEDSLTLDQSRIGPLGELQSLKVLFLSHNAFTGKEMVFHKNGFPRLGHLLVRGLTELEAWTVHEGALPCLLCLEIESCESLKSVPDGSQFLKRLKELKVRNMHRSFRERLEQGGQDWDIVSHVPSISFSYIYTETEKR